VADPLEICNFPIWVTAPNKVKPAAYHQVYGFGHLWADCRGPGISAGTLRSLLYLPRSNPTSVIMEICQKNMTSRVPPFKGTEGHWNWHGSIGTSITSY